MIDIVKQDVRTIINSEIIDWNRFKRKTILITGANGMLPSYMVFALLEANRACNLDLNIVALVRNKNKADKVFSSVINDNALSFIYQDVSNPVNLEYNVDFIVHAASQAGAKFYGSDPVGTLNANILGTHYLLEYARNNQCEAFLMFSSGGIYGEVAAEEKLLREEKVGFLDPLSVRNCYFESKRMAENMCVCYAFQYGVNTKIVRVFHTYGPCINLDDGRAFPDFCKAIINKKDIVLHSDGSAMRTFCYATDAVIAYFKILLDGNKAEAYNVGNPYEEMSTKELAEELVKAFPERGLKVVFDINEDNITYGKMKSPVIRSVPSIKKIESLGWKPSVNTIEGAKRIIMANI